MMHSKSESRLHQAFIIGLVMKAIDGLLELIGGLALLIVSPTTINGLAKALTQHELSEDPRDFIATHILHSAGALTHSAAVFGALYLLSHGLVKLVLILAVLREKLWAFPWMIGFIAVFMLYQIYRIGAHPTFGMIFLTVFDGVVVWLTWHEYQQQALKIATSKQ